jgi:hypothetical protein
VCPTVRLRPQASPDELDCPERTAWFSPPSRSLFDRCFTARRIFAQTDQHPEMPKNKRIIRETTTVRKCVDWNQHAPSDDGGGLISPRLKAGALRPHLVSCHTD